MKLFILSPACLLFAILQLASAQNLRPNSEHRELLTCQEEEKVECGLFRNRTGVLACREFGGWFPWSTVSKHTLCLPEDRTKDDDDCGCCEEPCPVSCNCGCDEDVDAGYGSAPGVYLNYTRTGKLRCVSEADSVTLQLLGVYECATECPPE